MVNRTALFCSIIISLLFFNSCQSKSDIFQAIDKESIRTVKKILDEEKYLVNARKGSFTPLSMAIKKKNIEIAHLLLNYGAEVDSRVGRHSSTSLMIASAAGCKECVALLLKAGAKINEKDDISMTPLLYSVTNGNIGVVKYLLKNGADINYQDKYTHENAFQKSALLGHYDIAKVLLENGAKANFNELLRLVRVKLDGIPYADESVKSSYKKIIELLKQAQRP